MGAAAWCWPRSTLPGRQAATHLGVEDLHGMQAAGHLDQGSVQEVALAGWGGQAGGQGGQWDVMRRREGSFWFCTAASPLLPAHSVTIWHSGRSRTQHSTAQHSAAQRAARRTWNFSASSVALITTSLRSARCFSTCGRSRNTRLPAGEALGERHDNRDFGRGAGL